MPAGHSRRSEMQYDATLILSDRKGGQDITLRGCFDSEEDYWQFDTDRSGTTFSLSIREVESAGDDLSRLGKSIRKQD